MPVRKRSVSPSSRLAKPSEVHESPGHRVTTGVLGLTPSGVVVCLEESSPLNKVFAKSEQEGLVFLGGHSRESGADETQHFWKGVVDSFLRELCHLPEGTDEVPGAPDLATLSEWTLNAPPMRGAEYLRPEILSALWERLSAWVGDKIVACGSIADFLQESAPAWSRVGRVTLHLAENPKDPLTPFAFMASYASDVSGSGRLTRLPLGRAMSQYSGQKNKAALLKLLTPLHRAAGLCPLMADLVESGDIFHPLAWTPTEAYDFLRSVPAYEDSGLLVGLPNWWKKRGVRPQVAATIGNKKSGGLGLESLLDFQIHVEVNGNRLNRKEVAELLKAEDGLVLFRGQWVEVDREKLRQALDHWESLGGGGVSFVEGMRLLAGAPGDLKATEDLGNHREWAFARPGAQLIETLRQLTEPGKGPLPEGLRATLRPYQSQGLEWLWFCARAGFGACLADDMGLGKTVQVLAALLRKQEVLSDSPPALLVVPASLIGNWKNEVARFAPSLRLGVVHRSESKETEKPPAKELEANDLVITTYGMLTRLEWLSQVPWSWVILDEAQAIKNPASRQSKAVRTLQARARIALTGTPVENNLGDLWAIFDFINPGLLGSGPQFKKFVKSLQAENSEQYAPLRRLVSPYILRRLKTDKSIISELPDKTEMKVFCGLSPVQARLYRQTAQAMAKAVSEASGMERRGLVLGYLMRFKQICNHPDQLTKAGGYNPVESAKFGRLGTLCEEIASRGEKALVFTQFRELTDPLESYLSSVFRRSGLVLHGGTAVRARQQMVENFQREDGPPFFVLSLKAGGTGLNLTAASHVIHFDRWWNPAVENQATDRAFRIGQHRNVLVHKFVTSGTLEEKIDSLIADKQETAEAILSGGPEKKLTEMNDSELLEFVSLDLSKAEAAL